MRNTFLLITLSLTQLVLFYNSDASRKIKDITNEVFSQKMSKSPMQELKSEKKDLEPLIPSTFSSEDYSESFDDVEGTEAELSKKNEKRKLKIQRSKEDKKVVKEHK